MRSDYVIASRLADKAVVHIKDRIKYHTKEMQLNTKYGVELQVKRYNAYLLGTHNYYNCATNCILDFERIAYQSQAVLLNRLKPRKRKLGESLPRYIDKLYGKSRQIRFVYGLPIIPISYIRHSVCRNYHGLSQYVEADRKILHTQQKSIPFNRLQALLKNPVRGKSVQYNDNRISMFVGQYGRCAVSGKLLDPDDIHCHHKKPQSLGGGDEYQNLVIVSKDIHKLIHATQKETIDYYLQKVKINKVALMKLNKLRLMATLEAIC